MSTLVEKNARGESPNAARTPAPARKAAEDIRREVWALAWPTIICNMLQNVGSLLNLYFVHGLGVRSMDAVAWGEQMIAIVLSVALGASVGTTALVARFTGAQDRTSAANATRQSLLLGAFFGVLTTGLLSAVAIPYLRAMGAEPASLSLALSYYRALLWGIVPFFLVNVSAAALRGAGDTRTPVVLFILMAFVSFLCDATMIWGRGPIPALGVLGAGYGRDIALVITAGTFLTALWRTPHGLLTETTLWRPDLGWWGRILRIGVPASAAAGLRSVAGSTYMGLLGAMAHGSAVVAAYSVGLRSEGIAFMPGLAFSVAAAALVGQSLGAKNPDRARRAARESVRQAVLLMAVMGLVFYVFAEPIARSLAAPEAVPFAVSYLKIAAISEPFLAVAMTLTGALQGAGDTLLPMLVVILTMWVLRLPPTWYFGLKLGFGAAAAWWAMSLSTCLQGTMIAAAWKSGRWRRIRV